VAGGGGDLGDPRLPTGDAVGRRTDGLAAWWGGRRWRWRPGGREEVKGRRRRGRGGETGMKGEGERRGG